MTTSLSPFSQLDITALVEQLRITRSCHSDPTSWHLGVQRALVLITEQFVRKGIVKDSQEVATYLYK